MSKQLSIPQRLIKAYVFFGVFQCLICCCTYYLNQVSPVFLLGPYLLPIVFLFLHEQKETNTNPYIQSQDFLLFFAAILVMAYHLAFPFSLMNLIGLISFEISLFYLQMHHLSINQAIHQPKWLLLNLCFLVIAMIFIVLYGGGISI